MSNLGDNGREILVPVPKYENNENVGKSTLMDSEHKRLQQIEQSLALRERELVRREAEVQRLKLELETENKRKDADGKRLAKPDVNLDEMFPAVQRPRHITSRELEIGPSIGSGKFADVSTAWLRVPCAVKKMRGAMTQENMTNFQREAAIMNACNHPNVIRLLGFCNEAGKYYLVQELVTGGNLHDRMHKKKQHLTYQQVVRVGMQVANGLAHLHSKNIVHRDIKPHNFVIDTSTEPAKVKLCDFGLARVKTGTFVETDGRLAGTPAYQAPEMLKLQPITEKVDQYSFAILVWEMITCQLPWWGKTFEEMVHCVTRLDERPAIPSDCPEALASIVRDCWQPNHELRPPFEVVAQRLKVVNDILKTLPEFRSKVGPKASPPTAAPAPAPAPAPITSQPATNSIISVQQQSYQPQPQPQQYQYQVPSQTPAAQYTPITYDQQYIPKQDYNSSVSSVRPTSYGSSGAVYYL